MSDARFKTNITTLVDALENLKKLRGVSYDWDQDSNPERNFDNSKQIGLIAQEIEKVYPELVNTDAKGYKSVEYSKLVAVLIEAIKEQAKLIEQQQNSLNQTKASIETIKASNTEQFAHQQQQINELNNQIQLLNQILLINTSKEK